MLMFYRNNLLVWKPHNATRYCSSIMRQFLCSAVHNFNFCGQKLNNVLNLIAANVNGARGMLTVSIISCTLNAKYINMQ